MEKLCTCGNNKFYASQQVWMDVIVNGNGTFEENVGCKESESPYGPFTCTKCTKEYDSLDELIEKDKSTERKE